MSTSTTVPLRHFLDKVASRSALGPDEEQAILDLHGHPVQVQSNRDFVRLGERVDHACLVVDGLVGRFGQNNQGGRQMTALHIAGDMADLHSVVTPQAASALQALTTTTLLKIPHRSLRDAVRRYPALAEAFWRECVIDAGILSEWVVNVGRRDARARTAHLLCEMAFRYEAAGAKVGFSFAFPPTQAHLADMLALTPVHVNRTLKGLREEGLAEIHDRTAHILDWTGLLRAGEFDPCYLHLRTNDDGAAEKAPATAAG